MTVLMARGHPASGRVALHGRDDESAALGRLLEEARAGRSGVLVLRGEAGVGKTALLEHVVDSASDFTVVRAVGVESEMELTYAALQQLCAPLLDVVDRIPIPQRHALETTFGLRDGPVPDPFLVGLATLSLFSEAAQQRPLLCAIDDAQWLDQASATSVGVRRAPAGGGVRRAGRPRHGSQSEGTVGFRSSWWWGSGTLTRERYWPRRSPGGWTSGWQTNCWRRRAVIRSPCWSCRADCRRPSWRAGSGCRERCRSRARSKRPSSTGSRRCPRTRSSCCCWPRRSPTGDPALLWSAAEQLGIADAVLSPAESAGLLEVEGRVRFRHPLVRSAVYRAATPHQRRRVHRALAEATDARADPDRRAWHLAEATAHPDEAVAAELERAAGRAQARGGLAAAGAFLERATSLTLEPSASRRTCAGGGTDQLRGGRPRRGPRTLGDCRRRCIPQARACPCRSAARSDRVCREARPRRPAALAQGCPRTRGGRPDSCACHLPGGSVCRDVRGPAGPRRERGRSERGRARRPARRPSRHGRPTSSFKGWRSGSPTGRRRAPRS